MYLMRFKITEYQKKFVIKQLLKRFRPSRRNAKMRIEILKNNGSQQQAIVKTSTLYDLYITKEFGDCWRWAEGKRKGKPCPASVEEKIRRLQ
jgi:hypothetical protein